MEERPVQPNPAELTFQQRLASAARLVEEGLARWLDDADAPPRLVEAMRYAVLGGGKRLRPFLLLESARLCGVANEEAVNAGAALECVHCYSLVHDDLPAMDDDDLRRGRPTVHRAFDEGTAILAGDALLTLAFEIMAHPSTHQDANIRAELTLALARASGWRGMAGGQMLDMEAPGRALGESEIVRLQAMKTGALIRFACEAGAMLGGAPAAKRGALGEYGAALGQAFQLADDLLDVEGDAAVIGKAIAKDADAGKATLVSLIGVREARLRLGRLEDAARAALAPFGEEARVLAEAARFVATRSH
jgi:farnesyl diphosphate synthase